MLRKGMTMVLFGLAAAAAVAAEPPTAATAQTDEQPGTLDGPHRGREAVAALGDDLPAVAARHGTTAARLRRELEADLSLWVDETGRLFYVEPPLDGSVAPAEQDDGAAAPAAVPADVFALHSRPGADRVIHLDFDGHTTTGTGWNDNPEMGTGSVITSAPYDGDGSPGSFSETEQAVIYDTWQRVAEDYAPFDIDVTTADPGVAAIDRSSAVDQEYGTRVVITSNNPIGSWCTCGGIAYVGVFNHTTAHAYYQPAFAFQAHLGGAAATGKTLAEAVTHEAGHNLGLLHDGTSTSGYYAGHGAWAPIMGVGYYRPISQWSAGEYTGANNAEDDLARMGTFGAPTLTDDHGDSTAGATPIGTSVSGRIGTATDVDVFSFTLGEGGQYTTVAVSPAPVGPNVDVHLSLLDGDGTLLLESDPPSSMVSAGVASGLGASVAATLPAGAYYLVVDGVGAGSASDTGYSDYGSLGTYDITVTHTTASCVAAPAGIVGWWKGEDSLAAEVGPDLTGGAGFAFGIVGRGIELDGPQGLPAVGFPTVVDGVTVEAWIRPEATGWTQAVFSRFRWIGDDDDDAFALFLSDDHLLWVAEEPSLMERPSLSVPSGDLFDGAFHHVAASWGGGEMAVYIDGVGVGTAPARGPLVLAPATDLIIGGTSTGPGHALAFSGVIDEPTVYDRALSAAEIQAIHSAGAGGKCSG